MNIAISLFGKFELNFFENDDSNITTIKFDNFGKELQNLFQLLLVNRKSVVSRETLTNTLYANRKDPSGCLKYAIFRLRDTLNHYGNIELILTRSSGYVINPDYNYIVDTELFEEYYETFSSSSSFSERCELCDKIIEVYRDYFYQTPSALIWTVTKREYFHNLFCKVIIAQGEEYCLQNDFEKAIEICQKANIIDKLNEDIDYILIKAFVESKQYVTALNYYKALSKLYMENYGEPLPQKIRKYFYVITSDAMYDKITPDNVHDILIHESEQNGAFYCNYDIFTQIYQIKCRKLKREKQDSYIDFILIINLENKVNEQAAKAWMEQLRKAISKAMRKGDIFTQANKEQFLIMCICHKYDDCQIIFNRISKVFYSSPLCAMAMLNYNIAELEPYDE